MTLRERFGALDGLKLAYVGDGNNVARSLLIAGAMAGVEVAVAHPARARRCPEARRRCPLDEAVRGAHALYTDVWVSMGDEDDAERKRALLAPYRLDEALMAHARDDAVALHCLPAHPGEEITEGVLYGERSAVWDQAENRLHAQKALLELLLSTDVRQAAGVTHEDLLALLIACLALGLVVAGWAATTTTAAAAAPTTTERRTGGDDTRGHGGGGGGGEAAAPRSR